ncbi:MAG: diguanylate cyclase [Pseudomonadota bacterium]
MLTTTLTPLAGIADLLMDAICVVDRDGRFIHVSAAGERIFGYRPEEMIGQPMIDMVLPEDRAMTLRVAADIMAGQAQPHFENRYIRKDGKVVHIMWSARWSEADQVRVAVARDITERKQAEAMQAALFAISEAAHAAEDPVALFRDIHLIIGGLLPVLNFSVALYQERTGQLSFPYHADAHGPVPRDAAAESLCDEIVRSGLPLLLPPALEGAGVDASPCWLGVPLTTQKGTIGAVLLKRDAAGAGYSEQDLELLQFVSIQVATAIERKQLYARQLRAAHYDELTGLPNRALLFERLAITMARTRRQKERMSLLYVDLDKFKQVNDTHGHAGGDLLLKEVARRLLGCVRDTDTVARMGGDEFVVLLENIQLPEYALAITEKINAALSEPLQLGEYLVDIEASIGIALYPEHGDDTQQLLQYADRAMYAVKQNGVVFRHPRPRPA